MNNTPWKAQTFEESIFSMDSISKKTVEEHLKLYEGYVKKYNEINEALAALTDEDRAGANQSYSKIRELKVELTFAWGGIVNHEIYFGHLGGDGEMGSGMFVEQVKKDFGSTEAYLADMKATAIAARGWVWTAWNHHEGRLFNYLGDAQNAFPVWGATPVVALDTYEHAYFIDHGAARAAYVDAFFKNMNWKTVEKHFSSMMMCCGDQGECCGAGCNCK